ncbi:UNVERIFIED_CONTAM: hypothetical protein FKN15_014677 [Acipenser sinensis]
MVHWTGENSSVSNICIFTFAPCQVSSYCIEILQIHTVRVTSTFDTSLKFATCSKI